MKQAWTRAALLGLIGLSVLGAGCAEERAPINRVQANALAKSFFVGAELKDISDDPEFYMRGTIVDVGYGAGLDGVFTSSWAQPVSRIKWEITEDYLNARLAYERIEGSDGKGQAIDGIQKKASNDGQIVASYKISSHFDIKRAYNPTTGEESNVIEENTTDRVWTDRKYMRVDWSQNLATDAYDFDTLASIGIGGSVTYEPLAFTVNDPADPDAPHFDADQGYFDVTNKAFATPAMIDLSSLGWGVTMFPACKLPGAFAGGTEPFGNCNPVEITLRQSFKKVVDKDFEPLDSDGYRFQAIGDFNFSYRYGYERNYGLVDQKWFRFAARYNIWERSHYYKDPSAMEGEIPCATVETTGATGDPAADPNRDLDGNGTADECEGAGPGSRCDVFKAKCTLPYAARKPVTIPWYIGGDTNEDLFEATDWAVQEWDLAMKTAIQTSRLVECRRTAGENCDARFPMWTGQQDDIDEAVAIARDLDACHRAKGYSAGACAQAARDAGNNVGTERGTPGDTSSFAIGEISAMDPVIVLCHNPVAKGDHKSCGARGLSPRLGDLRYNSVLIIEKPQTPSSWGIMVDADDPVTGEKVAASINIWSHVTDLATQSLVDMVRYMNGELATADITNGNYIRDWAQASRLNGGGSGPTMNKKEINRRLASATKLDGAQFGELTKSGLDPAIIAKLKPAHDDILDAAVRADFPAATNAAVSARMQAARGTAMEAKLINPAMLQVAGISGDLPLDGAVADAASPLALNNPKVQSQLRQMRENALAKRGACILEEAPEASALTGMADILAKKFPIQQGETPQAKKDRYGRMFKYIQRRYQYAVIAHEMGHSVGLRHNFVSSFDSLFYRPQYWQLRTKNGAVTKECTDSVDDGAGCVGPRYFDPMTEEERTQMIWMFMQSTVMDYPGDVTQDMIGLGAYDFAAARFFYGDTVAVYSDTAKIAAGTKVGVGLTNLTDNFGGLVGIQYSVAGQQAPEKFHYAQLQNQYGVINGCHAVSPAAPATWREDVDGIWDPLLDGKVVTIDGQATKCRQEPVDYAAWGQLRMPSDEEVGGGFYRGGPSVDPGGRLRVPYGFATDHWADTGNVSVFRHDNGADPYEQTMFLITTQENRHIFDNFRRGKTTFSVRAAADRSFSRYNEKLLGISGGIGFLSNIYKDFATNQGYSYDSLWPFLVGLDYKDNVIAATVSFDHFTRQISRPEDGEHYALDPAFGDATLRSAKDPNGNPGATSVIIPNGATGYFRDVGFGGRPLENGLSENHGDYDSEFTMNAGSYYDKINAAIILSESEDRFISQSRQDFYDARFRAVGMADVLPEGYRRILANALTNDRSTLAPHVAASPGGKPTLDTGASSAVDPLAKQYPAKPMAWTSWWPNEGPSSCFPSNGRNVCYGFEGDGGFEPGSEPNTAAIDPQVGWEVQKFLIAWTLAYIPANEQTNWLDMMRIYRLGQDADPSFEQRIEWQDPISGQVYYARTYGKECLFGNGPTCAGGKMVEKGIAARVLEYANELTLKGYKTSGLNAYGRAMVVYQPDGTPVVVSDPALKVVNPDGTVGSSPPTCDQNVDPTCTALTKYSNHWALSLSTYKSVPDYLWETVITYGLGTPEQLGVY